jgi:hypothetical protein
MVIGITHVIKRKRNNHFFVFQMVTKSHKRRRLNSHKRYKKKTIKIPRHATKEIIKFVGPKYRNPLKGHLHQIRKKPVIKHHHEMPIQHPTTGGKGLPKSHPEWGEKGPRKGGKSLAMIKKYYPRIMKQKMAHVRSFIGKNKKK